MHVKISQSEQNVRMKVESLITSLVLPDRASPQFVKLPGVVAQR